MSIGNHILLLDGTSLPDVALIGGKAWSIARMCALGLQVPPAFVITTPACAHVLAHGSPPDDLEAGIDEAINWLEAQTGRSFGGGPRPLLVSVRSGASISMPGMMDTVLNLGVTDDTEKLLGVECQSPAFARHTHRRFIDLYAGIVLKSPADLDPDGDPAVWRDVVAKSSGGTVPQDVRAQLRGAIDAVFNSWNSRRARRYRDHHGIPHDLGTAVTVQAMVFGNMDDQSGTGVLFSRNPLTGEAQPYGEFLRRAQGEDVVSGRHTPLPLDDLKSLLPKVHNELLAAARRLEDEAGDVQDIEFTVERGQLYLLQTRVAKRAPAAALRIAKEMVDEGRLSPAQALQRVSSDQVRILLSPRLSEGAADGANRIAKGEAASPGIGYGLIVTDSNEAEERAGRGEDVILARATTSPDDLHGMIAARAIVTERGGSTSHAAVVGRSLGRPCVVGCGAGAFADLAGQYVTVDGGSGEIFAGKLAVEHPSADNDASLQALASWARADAPLKVADNSADDSVIDVDAHAQDAEALRAAMKPGATMRGMLFAHDDDAVRAAVEAGVAMIVTSPTLPALVAAAHHAPAARGDAENRKDKM